MPGFAGMLAGKLLYVLHEATEGSRLLAAGAW